MSVICCSLICGKISIVQLKTYLTLSVSYKHLANWLGMSYVITVINNSYCFFGASVVGDYLVPWIPITIDNNKNVVRSKYCIMKEEQTEDILL